MIYGPSVYKQKFSGVPAPSRRQIPVFPTEWFATFLFRGGRPALRAASKKFPDGVLESHWGCYLCLFFTRFFFLLPTLVSNGKTCHPLEHLKEFSLHQDITECFSRSCFGCPAHKIRHLFCECLGGKDREVCQAPCKVCR